MTDVCDEAALSLCRVTRVMMMNHKPTCVLLHSGSPEQDDGSEIAHRCSNRQSISMVPFTNRLILTCGHASNACLKFFAKVFWYFAQVRHGAGSFPAYPK